jgi:hypothetical protein
MAHIPRTWSKEDATKETSSSNIANEVSKENYSNYFSRALNASRLIIL